MGRLSVVVVGELNLDIILYGERVVDEPSLKIPHPRYRERDFVMQPLREIAPEIAAGLH